MAYELVFTKEFLELAGKLDKSIRLEVDRAVGKIKEKPEMGKPLHGAAGLFSERVKNFRIVYLLENGKIYLVKVGKRKNVYEP